MRLHNAGIFYLYVMLYILPLIFTFDVPCTQKLIGTSCLFDEECYGMNTVCRNRRCVCPTNFENFDLNDEVAVCRPAPKAIGDSCQRDCMPPLLCRDGKCECWGGSVVNGKCTVSCSAGQQLYGVECMRVARYGQHCQKSDECVDPFTECSAIRMCDCSPGTIRDFFAGRCIANCPDGQRPQQSCKRLFINDIDMLDYKHKSDSCPNGFRCVTYGSPYVGHCCKMYCPFGEPDLSQSCDIGASSSQKCRQLTHYCQMTTEPGWHNSFCCARPCRQPTPLFIDGQCMAAAHRDDPCQVDRQCQGGVVMSCVAGVCTCKAGFIKRDDDRFPTCGKKCAPDQVDVAGECLSKTGLDQKCARSQQCPTSSQCRFGTCKCLCGFERDRFLGDRCTNPDDPLNLNTILSGVERIISRGQLDVNIAELFRV